MFKTGLVCVVLVGGLVCFGLRLQELGLQVAHDDQVHYGVHLLAGRLLSLCPCTAQHAQAQYARGMYHARTPLQAALLTSQRPTSLQAHLAEAPMLAGAGLRWLAARMSLDGARSVLSA